MKKANEPAVLGDKVESEKEDTYIKKLDKEDKHTKKTAFWKDKKERTAVISAIGLSVVIVASGKISLRFSVKVLYSSAV